MTRNGFECRGLNAVFKSIMHAVQENKKERACIVAEWVLNSCVEKLFCQVWI